MDIGDVAAMSMTELKEGLQALGMSTSTPGVAGQLRMEVLRARLEEVRAKQAPAERETSASAHRDSEDADDDMAVSPFGIH